MPRDGRTDPRSGPPADRGGGQRSPSRLTIVLAGTAEPKTSALWSPPRWIRGLLAIASLTSLGGVIHSPLPSGALFWPWAAPAPVTGQIAGAYGVGAVVCWVAAFRLSSTTERD